MIDFLKKVMTILLAAFSITSLLVVIVYAWTPVPVKEDYHVRMPGSQPPPEGSVTVEAPNRCLNCHEGYDPVVEPGFNWKGSMMAQASRDFLFFACLTVSAQDSIWATGNPNATDICLRCHFPKGWVEGRSDPTNGNLMAGADWDGVHCDSCHLQYDPFFEDTYLGTREGDQWATYWDESGLSSTPSPAAADETRLADIQEISQVLLYSGSPFFVDNRPVSPGYSESGGGQFYLSTNADKRASFADASANHGFKYSRHHKSRYFCSTCHDVSNPILANLNADPESNPEIPLPSETDAAHAYFHVERTFSEFMLSAYGQGDGAAGIGPFAPGVFKTSKEGNSISMCQDCHLRDSVGVACNKSSAVLRTGDPDSTESIEHPYSGQPVHDMTGGNIWVSTVLASTSPVSANYDAVNENLLTQGPGVLTLDLTAGEGIDPAALLAGAERARQQLTLAADIQDIDYDPSEGDLSFRIQNQTGHKLISGFPEGRRMFVNIRFFSQGDLQFEVNPYDSAAGTLKGLDHSYTTATDVLPMPLPLGPNEVHVDQLVYEMKPSSSLTGESKTFHFALATDRYKDNRIPPKGFRINEANERLCQPRWGNVDQPDYFTPEEYAGGFDEIALSDYGIVVPDANLIDFVEVNLYYQTTSREYIEFLRDEINGTGNLVLSSPTPSGEANAYVVQSDSFFNQLAAWGDTIWELWLHNMNIDGAAPVRIVQNAAAIVPEPCDLPVPNLYPPVPDTKKLTLAWSDESGDDDVLGYRLYYDQAGKSLLVTQIDDPAITSFIDTDLLGGVPRCYKVTSTTSACESDFSDILCGTPFMAGDLNRDMAVDLHDTVVGLMLMSDQEVSETVYSAADVDQDNKIGLQDVVYSLQVVSGLR
jgi:hypothetical protein